MFVVPAGTKTAPSNGETGSGKRTCGYLVARLYDTTEGRRSTGSTCASSPSRHLRRRRRRRLSETTFHASVRENLRFARPDATDAEIEEAVRAAQVHDLIASLPDGYDTVVGERATKPGGEKQRIAIARTILATRPSSCWTR